MAQIFEFGKYNGETFDDVVRKDIDYCKWAATNANSLDDFSRNLLYYKIEEREFLDSDEWHRLRKDAFWKYGHSCLRCFKNSHEIKMCVDHIQSRYYYKEKWREYRGLWSDIENLQPLCDDCNTEKGWATADYRPKAVRAELDDVKTSRDSLLTIFNKRMLTDNLKNDLSTTIFRALFIVAISLVIVYMLPS